MEGSPCKNFFCNAGIRPEFSTYRLGNIELKSLTIIMSSPDSMPTSIDTLLLPIQSQNFSKTLSSLKRDTLSITNRFESIKLDSEFVQSIAEIYRLPLIANERCGSWYIPSSNKVGGAYFKSTDGHVGQWAFSMRRLNLQMLETIGQSGG